MFTLFRLSLISLLVALSASAAVAQQIQGQVRYADSGQSAIGVLVRCDGTGGISDQLTDRNGKFYFRVSPGHYTVITRAVGFVEEQQSRDLIDTQQSEYLFFTLKPASTAPALVRANPMVIDATVPAEAEREFEKGEAALAGDKKDREQEAINHLEKAVSIYPHFLQAQLRLGAVYMDLQQWDKAERALRRALLINPKTANAFFALGEIYLRQKKYSEAEKELLNGLAMENRSWQGHFTLGRVYWTKGDLSRAGRQVGLAIQLNPDFADAYLLAGNILLRANKPEDALANFEKYLILAPKGEYAAQAREAVQKLKKSP